MESLDCCIRARLSSLGQPLQLRSGKAWTAITTWGVGVRERPKNSGGRTAASAAVPTWLVMDPVVRPDMVGDRS